MTEEGVASRLIEPIDNASKPATIATLNFAVVILIGTNSVLDSILRTLLGAGGIMFLVSALSIFFFTISPSRRKLWLVGSLTFLVGLVATIAATGIAVAVSVG